MARAVEGITVRHVLQQSLLLIEIGTLLQLVREVVQEIKERDPESLRRSWNHKGSKKEKDSGGGLLHRKRWKRRT